MDMRCGDRRQDENPVAVREFELCEACEIVGSCRQGIDDLRRQADGTVRGEIVVPSAVAGRAVAHGGWTAWVFDELLGYTANSLRGFSVTAELAVKYRRPVPLGARVVLTASGRMDGERRRLMRGEMRCVDTGGLLASAEGVWIELADADAHYARATARPQKTSL
ncbi:PaaI family thioesterase [Nocardioides ginsengisoli]|uniref:Acyl-coenzyme A thioesterase THEM4 n=1 Tax=Nocardioides ginsengisoli TaxID=363868 RepID=A0ABW3VW50_9ACTN